MKSVWQSGVTWRSSVGGVPSTHAINWVWQSTPETAAHSKKVRLKSTLSYIVSSRTV